MDGGVSEVGGGVREVSGGVSEVSGGGAEPRSPRSESGGAAAELRIDFGPYAGLTVEEAVQLDPEHMRRMVAAEIGPPELRARAARLLLVRPRSTDLRRGWSQGVVAASVAGMLIWGAHTAYDRVGTPGASARGAGQEVGIDANGTAAPSNEESGRTFSQEARSEHARSGGRDALRPEEPIGVDGEHDDPPARSDDAGLVAGERRAGGSADSGVAEDKACGQRASGSIGAEEAETSTGTDSAVEFRVVGTHDSGKVTFLNSHDPYQNHFYVAVFPDDYDAFPSPPSEYFHGKCVVVQGRIELYRGTPQIVLRRPTDIVVVGE